MLNIDYKILAHVLAKRLQVSLPIIISNDQQGFIKNRFIGFNIRLIQDVIDFTNLFDTEGILLFLDFKKAFDTVEWSFMFKVLKKFGFKDSFIRWTRIMYNNITSIVANNGWLSDPFSISRGIRQGCPLSALLFVIVAEILATKIQNSTTIEGIKVASENGENYIKICQLADDTTLFLKNETYLLQSISIPKEFLNELNKIFFKFLWSNKVEKIKRKILIGPKIDSGLDMIDLNIFTKTIRVKWINLLNNETQAENNTTFFS